MENVKNKVLSEKLINGMRTKPTLFVWIQNTEKHKKMHFYRNTYKNQSSNKMVNNKKKS